MKEEHMMENEYAQLKTAIRKIWKKIDITNVEEYNYVFIIRLCIKCYYSSINKCIK